MGIERFLIVDEVEANALFFNVVLTELGRKNITTASNGEVALAAASKHNVQFVIAAWEMNTMSGTVLVQRLKSERKKYMPYLLYSKRMSEQDLQLTRELGLPNMLSLPLDRAKARDEIKALIEREENLPREEVTLRKIDAYIADNKPNEALQLIDAKIKKAPYAVRTHVALGQIWMMVNQLVKAEESLQAALTDDAGHFEAASILANLYSRTGRHDQAIAQLQAMTQKSPKNLTTLLNLGSAYVEADRPDEAKKTFAMVSTIDPDFPPLKDEQGKLAFKQGDLPLAAQLLAETQNGDGLARHFNNMAIGLTHQQQFDKAITTYESAIKILVNKAKVHALHYNLGLALAKKGELARSFNALASSYRGDPTFEKAYAALARISKQMQEQGLAYDKALAREINQLRQQQKAAATPPAQQAS